MLAQATKANQYGNCHSIIDIHSNIILMVKLIQETEVFKIQPGCGSVEGNKFLDLFVQGFAIMNAGISFKNDKKCIRGNWS